MRFGRYIGYARAETKGDLDKLDDWAEQLQQLGVKAQIRSSSANVNF